MKIYINISKIYMYLLMLRICVNLINMLKIQAFLGNEYFVCILNL